MDSKNDAKRTWPSGLRERIIFVPSPYVIRASSADNELEQLNNGEVHDE
jgi:hypothetical protein